MDKEKFYRAVDTFPIVRVLQVVALLIFVLAVLQIALTTLPILFSGHAFLPGLMNLIASLVQATFMPLVLLSLAEIIKLLRVK
jgi:hypothetical protein